MTPPRQARAARKGRRERAATAPPLTVEQAEAFFVAAVPESWFADPPTIRHDADEILVTGNLGPPGAGLSHEQQIGAFREATREQRMSIADQAEAEFHRKVSWGVECGDAEVRFTTVNAPAMTRLRIEERLVLDTLIDAGIARSRSEALAWCVHLVGRHEHDWIAELRDALDHVAAVRDNGPDHDETPTNDDATG